MNKKLNFEIENAEIISEEPSSEFATARITAFSDGVSRHNTICDVEALKRTAPTIYETPLVYEYDSRFSDFGTHSEKPVIAGFVVPNSAEFYERNDGTGRTSLSVLTKVWKRYAPQFIDIFKRDGTKKRSVSVEMEIRDSEEEGEHLRLKDWVYTAICVLGEMVTPASPDAELEMLSFAEKNNQEYKEAYELEFGGRYDDLNFKIPSSVKNNAKQGLELREKLGRGGTSVGLATARYLVKNDVASPEKVRHIAKYFPRHAAIANLDDKESNSWVAWNLWGGDAGRKWSTSLVKKMDELDEKKMSYFAEEEEMPYKSMKDANPAIKGIDPEPTLSQANQIAKEADAIGSDEEKNGWSIAIANFKKTHVAKDGKWVKKEDKEFSDLPEDNYLGIENFSYNSSQILEILNTAIGEYKWGEGYRKYWVESFDETYAYVHDNEDEKYYRIPYQLSGGICTYDLENKENVIRGGFELMANVNEEDKKFNYAEIFADEKFAQMFAEVEEDQEEEEREEGEKESYAQAKEEFGMGMNPSAVMSAMYSAMKRMGKRFASMKEKMAKMESDKEVYLAENADMKQRFAEQEAQQKEMAVDAFMKEMAEKVEMAEEQVSEMKEKSKEFSFDKIEDWKNHVKAFCFDFKPKKTQEENEDKTFSFALGFEDFKIPQTENVWDKLSK